MHNCVPMDVFCTVGVILRNVGKKYGYWEKTVVNILEVLYNNKVI